jgi:hypothetical protein
VRLYAPLGLARSSRAAIVVIVVIEYPDDDFHRYAGRSGIASQLAQEPAGEVLLVG